MTSRSSAPLPAGSIRRTPVRTTTSASSTIRRASSPKRSSNSRARSSSTRACRSPSATSKSPITTPVSTTAAWPSCRSDSARRPTSATRVGSWAAPMRSSARSKRRLPNSKSCSRTSPTTWPPSSSSDWPRRRAAGWKSQRSGSSAPPKPSPIRAWCSSIWVRSTTTGDSTNRR